MEETPNTNQKKKKLLESNRILSATALFVSICTLFILVYQTHLSNKMYYLEDKALKASAMPILELGTSSGNDYFVLGLRNVGIGPAKIKQVYVKYGDKVFAEDMYATIMDGVNPHRDDHQKISNFGFGTIAPNQVIPISGNIQHIVANDSISAVKLKKLFFEEEPKINMAITYTSIYEDEEWTTYLFDSFTIPPDTEVKKLH